MKTECTKEAGKALLTREEVAMILEAKLPRHTVFVDERFASFRHPDRRAHKTHATISIVPGLGIQSCDQFDGDSLNAATEKALAAIETHFVC